MMAERSKPASLFKDMPDAEPDALLRTDSARQGRETLRFPSGRWLLPYSPRKIRDFYEAMPKPTEHLANWAPTPKIHEAVFGRIRVGRASVRADSSFRRV